jgi:hypothetical protein
VVTVIGTANDGGPIIGYYSAELSIIFDCPFSQFFFFHNDDDSNNGD